ncbi:uncharacterized protein LOC133492023 isoform X13 [Syngnathoides biaculeatus]|uniref:uncharacterized protein LOC133492023 isoform X13 n=1 Tax=Syngnathoides biaculeatus TaxID=300417 RepID=UPI002ADE58DF|nr:uncharacterized protein LOC133492023 isoform X13 [Syngnathoides biaculeatus]
MSGGEGDKILVRALETCSVSSKLSSSSTSGDNRLPAFKDARSRGYLQWTIKTADQFVGTTLPTLEDLHTIQTRTRTGGILSDHPHPGHHLFQLLRSDFHTSTQLHVTTSCSRDKEAAPGGDVLVHLGGDKHRKESGKLSCTVHQELTVVLSSVQILRKMAENRSNRQGDAFLFSGIFPFLWIRGL